MRSSRFALICFLAALLSTACSGQRRPPAEAMGSFSEASLKTGALVQRYGQIVGTEQRAYLTSLESFLKVHLPQHIRQDTAFKIILLDAKKPMAYSPGAGYVVISKGMVTALATEAQLAFVLAHEMSHYYLGHSFASSDEEAFPDPAQELAADKMAAGIVAMAGYDPTQSLDALKNIYRSANPYLSDAPSHPDFTSRTRALQREIAQSGWRPPGMVDRRDFKRFKKSL